MKITATAKTTGSDHNSGSLPNNASNDNKVDASEPAGGAVLVLSDCDSVLFHGGSGGAFSGSNRAERRGSKSGDSAFTGNLSNYAWSQEGMDDEVDLDFDDDDDNYPAGYQGDDINDFVPWGAANNNQNDTDSKQSKDSLYLDDDDDEEGNALQATTSDGKTLAEAFARVTGRSSTAINQDMDGNQEDGQSELELRIMAAQVLAAQADIDSPLDLPEKYKRKSARAKPGANHKHSSDSGSSSSEEKEETEASPEEASQEEKEYVPHQPQDEESVEELFVEDDPVEAVEKDPESPTSSQREEQRTASTGEESSSSVDEQQQKQLQEQLQKQKRKEERRSRRSSDVDAQQKQLQKRKEERRNRRSSCRQSKVNALAAKVHKDVDDDHDTDTELMDQSSTSILSASSTTHLMDQSSNTILSASSRQSSILGGASADCDDSSHCSDTIPTTKTSKQDRSSRRSSRRQNHRASRGSEHSAPKLPGGSCVSGTEQRPRDPSLTRAVPPQQPQRLSLFGRLYNGASHDSFAGSAAASSAKPKTELMMLLEKGNTDDDRYGHEMEDISSVSTDDRSTHSKISIVKSISSAFSFGLSLGGGGRSHRKKTKKGKETKKKHHHDDGGLTNPAAAVHRSRRTKEDKPIAPPKTNGTKQRHRHRSHRRREAPPVEDTASLASC